MPHARSAHHPRSASNKTNNPETSNITPGKTENWKETIAATSKTTPTRPRTIRPLVSMLREKYLFISFGVCLAERPWFSSLTFSQSKISSSTFASKPAFVRQFNKFEWQEWSRVNRAKSEELAILHLAATAYELTALRSARVGCTRSKRSSLCRCRAFGSYTSNDVLCKSAATARSESERLTNAERFQI